MAIASLIIRLKDESSRGIARIGNALAGLDGKASAANSGMSGFAASVRNGVLQASAVQLAIGKAAEAVGFLNNQFQQAAQLQTQSVATVASFAALTGLSSKESANFMADLNKRLAEGAKELPGVTSQYKALAASISDNLVSGFKDANGKVDLTALQDNLVSFSENYGVLTDSSTKDIQNTGLFLSKALSGTLDKSLSFVEQNPALIGEIERRLAETGKELNQLNLSERIKIFKESAEKFITPEYKKQAAETVEALTSSFFSDWMDIDTGKLGINRDLNESLEGTQSVFSSLNDALKEIIGPNGVFNQLAGILEAAGIQLPDPMAALKSGIDFAVRGLKALNRGLSYMKSFIEAGHTFFEGLLALPGFVGITAPTLPGEQSQQAKAGISNILLNVSPELVLAAAGAVGTIALLNTGFLAAAGSSATFIFTVGARGVVALRNFGLMLQWTTLTMLAQTHATIANTGANLRFIASLPGQAARSAAGGMRTLAASATSLLIAMQGLTLGSVLGAARGAFIALAGGVRVATVAFLANPITWAIGAIALAALLIYKYWNPIKGFITGFFSGLMEGLAPIMPAFQSLGQTLTSVFGPAIQLVGALLGGLFSAIGSLFQPVQDADGSWRSFGETVGKFVGGAIVGTINLVVKLIDSVKQGIAAIDEFVAKGRNAPGLVGAGFRFAFGEGEPQLAVGSRYRGNIGNAAGGFLGELVGAARREMANMPAGAQLLVANSSETIIPQGMLGALASAITPTAIPTAATLQTVNRGGNTFNISFSVNGASGDPGAIAQQVVAEIQRRFEGELNAQLV